METTFSSGLVWLRRDLRVADHAALYHALKNARRVWCVFVLDTDILHALPRQDRRVDFILRSLQELDVALGELQNGSGLIVRHGSAVHEIPQLVAQLGVQAVYANHDDEPAALARDAQVRGNAALALVQTDLQAVADRVALGVLHQPFGAASVRILGQTADGQLGLLALRARKVRQQRA